MKYINYILIGITILCLYVIGCVGLEIFPTLGYSEKANAINSVVLNLSYSFIAGWIFYLLVSYFPYKQRKSKLQKVIDEKFKNIHVKFIDCAKSMYPMTQWNNIHISKENLIKKMKNISITDMSSYSIAGINRTIIDHLIAQRTDIKNLIKEILEYKEYLNDEQLVIIEQIRNSTYFSILNAFAIPIMNNPQVRESAASELYKQIELSRRLLEKTVKSTL